MLPRARTIAFSRRLRALGPIRQPRARGKLPRQQQPDTVRIEYFKAIRHVVDNAHRELARVVPELVHGLEALRRRQGIFDIKISIHQSITPAEPSVRHDIAKGLPLPETGHSEADRARGLVHDAARRFSDVLRPGALHSVALQFGQQTSAFQRQQLDRQVRHAIGVPFSAIERPTRDRLHLFASSNAELIKTVPDRYFDRIIKTVTTAYVGGTHPATMAQEIADDYQIGLNDAMRIARDQIGKLNGQVNADRQQAIGVQGFFWRGVMDNRERDSHRVLEGKRYDWDELPIDEDTGEEIAPGDAIQCRCFAEPDFSDLLSDDE